MKPSPLLGRRSSSAFPIPSPALDEVTPGSRVRLSRMVFELVRSRCWDWGLSEGDVVSCHGIGDDGIRLALADGRTVRVAMEYARFIEVRSLDEP